MGRQYRISYEENGREFSFIHVFALKENSKDPVLRLREVEKIIEKGGAEVLGDYLNPKKITRIEEL